MFENIEIHHSTEEEYNSFPGEEHEVHIVHRINTMEEKFNINSQESRSSIESNLEKEKEKSMINICVIYTDDGVFIVENYKKVLVPSSCYEQLSKIESLEELSKLRDELVKEQYEYALKLAHEAHNHEEVKKEEPIVNNTNNTQEVVWEYTIDMNTGFLNFFDRATGRTWYPTEEQYNYLIQLPLTQQMFAQYQYYQQQLYYQQQMALYMQMQAPQAAMMPAQMYCNGMTNNNGVWYSDIHRPKNQQSSFNEPVNGMPDPLAGLNLNTPEAKSNFHQSINSNHNNLVKSFVESSMAIREAYLNKLNSIACGMQLRPVPWNEGTEEFEIQEIIKAHPEYELDYLVELYEEKMLSMGLDPTEGMFKQFIPGEPVLSSKEFKHLNYMNQNMDSEGLNNPAVVALFNSIEPGPSEDDDFLENHIEYNQQPQGPNGYSMDEVMNIMRQQQYMNQIEMINAIGLPPKNPFTGEIPTVDRPLSFRERRDIMMRGGTNGTFVNFYVDLLEIKQNKPYIDGDMSQEDLDKAVYYEAHKTEMFKELQDLVTMYNQKAMVNTWYMNPQVRQSWNNELQNLNRRIEECKSKFPKKNEFNHEYYDNEFKILTYNYQAQQYNDRKFAYLQNNLKRDQMQRGLPITITAEEMAANGFYYNPKARDWMNANGRYFNPENNRIYDESDSTMKMMQNNLDALERRREVQDLQMVYMRMFLDSMKLAYNMSEDEALEIWNEKDPFGLQRRLDYDPTLQTISTQEAFEKRQPTYINSHYVWEEGKYKEELTPEERKRNIRREYNKARNEKARNSIPLDIWTLLNYQGKSGLFTNNRTFDARRLPLMAANQAYGKSKDLNDAFRNMEKYVGPALEASERMTLPKSFAGYYDHNKFNETLDNYGHKTQIGRVSDLLTELDNNEQFAKAMNEGVLGLTLPDELGFNYNKRRVEFDNSILEQMEETNRPFPEGARIKDFNTETYNDRPLNEIQREQYEKKMKEASRLKGYFSPELGGTWDGVNKINPN